MVAIPKVAAADTRNLDSFIKVDIIVLVLHPTMAGNSSVDCSNTG